MAAPTFGGLGHGTHVVTCDGSTDVSSTRERGLSVGDAAPDFALSDADGRTVHLSDYRGKQHVVVYFYPRDHTPACTVQACTFRDQYEAFTAAGAEVIGISVSGQASHASFTDKHKLPFVLLSDPGGEVRKRYGVPATLGFLPGRTTYVIDREGVIRHIFTAQLRPRAHIEEALRTINELACD